MRPNPLFESTDPEDVRALVESHPWATLVSAGADASRPSPPIASHYPVLLDEDAPGLALLTHVGRPDDELHGFGEGEVLVIVQGRHGYVSPSWYAPGATRAPTWNFSVAHCYGVPQLLSAEENLRTLTRLVERFERHVDEPMLLEQEYGARLAAGTVGLRIPVTRFICKLKLSQDKDAVTRERVIGRLRAPGPYRHLELAEDMERLLRAPAGQNP